MMKIKLYMIILFLLPLFPCLAQEIETQNFYENPVEDFTGLREQAFSASAKDLGIAAAASEPWCVIMEMGVRQAAVTLVALKDGAASLYLSNGGVIIGKAEEKSVSVSAKNLVTVAKDYISKMNKTQDHPLPEIGKVRFYLLAGSGIFASEFLDEQELANGAHQFSGLFYLGREVVTALQNINKKQ